MEFPEAPLFCGSGATSLLAKASCGTKRRPSFTESIIHYCYQTLGPTIWHRIPDSMATL